MTCEACGGNGATVKRTPTSLSTHPCACRTTLPPRAGRATWWSLEPLSHQVVSVLGSSWSVSVDVEVPMSDDNYRLQMRGNRYYPTMVTLEDDTDTGHSLLADEARMLAQRLIEAADLCDKTDAPDQDACGHWFPCGCGRVTR